MAKSVKRNPARTAAKKVYSSPFNIYWEKNNYLLLAAGAMLIIAGFYFMSLGSWDSFSSLVISPILLLAGYLLVFPASIFYRRRKDKSRDEVHSSI